MSEEHRRTDRVVETLLGKLAREYPDWRVTTHMTPAGREVMLIEYAGEDGGFESGLPSEFVSLVADYGEDSAGAESDA